MHNYTKFTKRKPESSQHKITTTMNTSVLNGEQDKITLNIPTLRYF